jgi:hypothetical protein
LYVIYRAMNAFLGHTAWYLINTRRMGSIEYGPSTCTMCTPKSSRGLRKRTTDKVRRFCSVRMAFVLAGVVMLAWMALWIWLTTRDGNKTVYANEIRDRDAGVRCGEI